MSNTGDIEAYLAGADPATVVGLLGGEVGAFVTDADGENGGVQLFVCGPVKLLITPNVQDGYIGVWLRGSSRWRSDVEFARFLSTRLGCRARCDPGAAYPDVDPRSDVFLDISDGNEKLVVWD